MSLRPDVAARHCATTFAAASLRPYSSADVASRNRAASLGPFNGGINPPEVHVPRYIIEREVGSITRAELEKIGRLSNEVIADMPGVIWIKSYISEAEGKIYCEYDAPSPEAIVEHARRAGLPVHKISEIALEVSPDMFV